MKCLFLVSFFMLSIASLQAQLLNLNSADGRPIILEKNNIYDGSPYLNEDFKDVILTLDPSKEYKTLGRINFLSKVYEYKFNGELYEIDFSDLKSILFVEEKMLFRILMIDGKKSKDLYQILFENEVLSLIKKVDFGLIDQNTDSYSNTNNKRRIVKNESFYIYRDESLFSFKKNKRSFISILPEELKERAENFFKENKVSFNKEEDLVMSLKSFYGLN
ncbi:hypothetical protein [Belliella pelovolcani]|uniref:Uncharacterized protein n=1 Tax=Belliella pelovolcani TaxID=529505 RepID=A0A1N7MYS7_9BACT|nr:hypothetical protein [Belliella pelovolcani]SIS91266.1 hypothetical protein SAMN05421761_1082 [Belliella pelovolcani]